VAILSLLSVTWTLYGTLNDLPGEKGINFYFSNVGHILWNEGPRGQGLTHKETISSGSLIVRYFYSPINEFSWLKDLYLINQGPTLYHQEQ